MACITAMPSDKDQHFPLRNAFVSSLQAESFVGSFFFAAQTPRHPIAAPKRSKERNTKEAAYRPADLLVPGQNR